MQPLVDAFFDQATFTVTYIVVEPSGPHCVIIDSVLDYDPKSGRTSTRSADRVIDYIEAHDLKVVWILETHAHADHISAAPYLKERLGGALAIGEHIVSVQQTFAKLFNLGAEFSTDGSQFDHVFADGERFAFGEQSAQVLHTPGHTPACISFLMGDAVFVGDTLFMPDYGTARADFPGGDAATLYRSIQKLLALPNSTRVFLCHDYKAPGRDAFAWESTVKEQRESNVHLRLDTTEQEFVSMRNERDQSLAAPTLLLPSVQVNIRAGELPPPEKNGISYLKIPLNAV